LDPVRIPLNDVSLSDVQARLGSAKVFEVLKGTTNGQSATALRMIQLSLCFQAESWRWKQLLAYHCNEPPCTSTLAQNLRLICPNLPYGLHLGMTEQEFLKATRVSFEKTNSTTLRRFVDLKRTITAAESNKRYSNEEISRFIQDRGGMDVSQAFGSHCAKGK